MSTWPAYLEAVRAEVREGVGIFSEDDDLRTLFEECFERGNSLTGTVLWSEAWQESFPDSGPIRDV